MHQLKVHSLWVGELGEGRKYQDLPFLHLPNTHLHWPNPSGIQRQGIQSLERDGECTWGTPSLSCIVFGTQPELGLESGPSNPRSYILSSPEVKCQWPHLRLGPSISPQLPFTFLSLQEPVGSWGLQRCPILSFGHLLLLLPLPLCPTPPTPTKSSSPCASWLCTSSEAGHQAPRGWVLFFFPPCSGSFRSHKRALERKG